MHVERAWLIECTRCANEGVSCEVTDRAAAIEFQLRGWTTENARTYCPACNDHDEAKPKRKASA